MLLCPNLTLELEYKLARTASVLKQKQKNINNNNITVCTKQLHRFTYK